MSELDDKNNLAALLRNNNTSDVDELTPEAQVLFHFLVLVVDIKYRQFTGNKLENHNGRGYSLGTMLTPKNNPTARRNLPHEEQ